MKPKRIYLDYAATTPVDARVLKAMMPFFSDAFGNTMSIHGFGQEAKVAVEKSRQTVADLMKAKSSEIIFTASATESNNLALKGIALANEKKGNNIIISSIEHPCIIEAAAWLEKRGFYITRLKVDRYGLINLEDLEKNINKNTILVSIMQVNNEIGTIEPVKEIGSICRQKGVLFHTDASQSFGKIPIDVQAMNIDLLTASSHKMYGPKGAACLFIREGIRIEPILHGGGHEFGLRPSTLNTAAIVGFAKACQICGKEMKKENKRLTVLRERMIKGLIKNIDNCSLNGHPVKRLANNINMAFSFVEGESLVMQLDMMGIAASTGSACSSDQLTVSHVLSAIGLKPQQIHGSLRFSLGRWTTKKDIDAVLKVLPGAVKRLREISPFKK